MVDRFRGKFRFLSNFWPVEVEYEGESYPSVEHAYQAAKAVGPISRLKFQSGAVPKLSAGQAKRWGRICPVRPEWNDEFKLAVMKDLLEQKFQKEPLRSQLLDTKEEELVEGNDWNDTFWGKCNGEGLNWLGVLLMQVRENLRGVA